MSKIHQLDDVRSHFESIAHSIEQQTDYLKTNRLDILNAVEEWSTNTGTRKPVIDIMELLYSYVGVCAHLEELADNGVSEATTHLPRFNYLSDVIHSMLELSKFISEIGASQSGAEYSEVQLRLIHDIERKQSSKV
jgi:hypothetical protein